MQTRILTHLTKYNILSNNQYGFRKSLKTEDAIYKVTSEILNALNKKLYVGGIPCDLEKAFDCVDHEIMLSKLKFYGINGRNHTLYQSYWRTDILEHLFTFALEYAIRKSKKTRRN
jgi:hypothetical protein